MEPSEYYNAILSLKEIDCILKSLARKPFILSATFHKILTNALCTTARIKNHPTMTCFACGKARDDLYHFLRCPYVAFLFNLPPAFGTLKGHGSYFSPSNIAKLTVLFESYYIITRQYGQAFLKSPFHFVANKISNIARHVAIKNKILHLSHSNCISYAQVDEFLRTRNNVRNMPYGIPDAALCL